MNIRIRADRVLLLISSILLVIAIVILFCGMKYIKVTVKEEISAPETEIRIELPRTSEPKEQLSSTKTDWKLVLVNPWNKIPNGYEVELTELKNGQAVDSRCYSELQRMMDACRWDGLFPLICSSYRTQEKQESLYSRKVEQYINKGYSQMDAEAEAAKVVAVPGTSEHQLGLAVDIVDMNNQNLDESQETTAVSKWLAEHCWEYGFILRYPEGKSDITGIIYEPWHYRYVGREAALEIYERGICLEEYLEGEK